jgi:hypothetical protein
VFVIIASISVAAPVLYYLLTDSTSYRFLPIA